jgi:hypothetical protein
MSEIASAGQDGAGAGAVGDRDGANGGSEKSPKELVTAAASTVKQEVAAFASTVEDKAKDQMDGKKVAATETMAAFANAIRHAGDELAQQDQSMAGRVVKQAADGLEHLSRTVSEKRPEELLEAVRDFGRSNPTAFIAGSVLLGVALGRFARSSEARTSDAPATYVQSQDFGPRPGASEEPVKPGGGARLESSGSKIAETPLARSEA